MGTNSCLFSCLCQSHKRAPLNRFTISFSLFAIISFYSEEVIWLLPNFASNWPSWKLDTKMLCDWASNHWALHFFYHHQTVLKWPENWSELFHFFRQEEVILLETHFQWPDFEKTHAKIAHTCNGPTFVSFLNWSERSTLGCWHKRRWPLFLLFFFILQKRSYRISIFCMGS